MSKALNDLKGALSNAGDYIEALEVELEDLDEYNNLFDDVNEARDIKDYYDELSNIFDDTYDAEQAKALAEACEWQGWDDVADVEEAAGELQQYRDLGDFDEVQEAVHNSDGGTRVADLEKKLADAEATIQKLIGLEDMRVRAIRELRGITLEQHEIDKTGGEEKAYECGLNDGLILSKDRHGEQGIPLDIIIAPEEV